MGKLEQQRKSRDPIAAVDAPQDVWSVMARAGTADSPRTVAAMRRAREGYSFQEGIDE